MQSLEPKRSKPSQSAYVLISGDPVKDATHQPLKLSLSAGQEPSNSGRKFECKECGNSFSYRHTLKRHFTRAHRGKVISEPPVKPEDNHGAANSSQPPTEVGKGPTSPEQCIPLCISGHPVKDATHQPLQLSLSAGQDPSNSGRKFKCIECGNLFSYRHNLKRHFTRAHRGKVISESPVLIFKPGSPVEDIHGAANSSQPPTEVRKEPTSPEQSTSHCISGDPVKGATNQPLHFSLSADQDPSNSGRKFECIECGNLFSHRHNLKRHFTRAHKGKVLIEPPAKTFKHTCELCSRNFNYIHHLRAHHRTHHPQNVSMPFVKPKILHKCFFCPMFLEKQLLFQHYDSEHGTKIEKEDLHFDNIESFLSWKDDLEHNDKCHYIIDKRYEKYYAYKCHRSGYYNRKGKGLRRMKKQGTKKINFLCPSNIKVKLASDGKCTVSYTKTHIGHEMELGHVSLTALERQQLAEQIALKIPLDAILNDVRDSVTNSGIERLHLLTRQDLYNIERCHNLNSDIKKKSNATTVSTKTDRNNLLKEYKDIIQNANKSQLDFIKRSLLNVKATISTIKKS